jgi:hypothetical protein
MAGFSAAMSRGSKRRLNGSAPRLSEDQRGALATGEDRKVKNICYRMTAQQKSDPASADWTNAQTGSNDSKGRYEEL